MLMAELKHQLRALLEQSCQMVDELVSDAVKLVVEVQAIHYWTTHSLETFRQLQNIGRNIRSMLSAMEEVPASMDALLGDPAGEKLAKTIYGLWRALPGLTSKYTEQLSRRRRQRIMGIDPEDTGELPAEQLEKEAADLKKTSEQVATLFAELKLMVGKIPQELAVVFETDGGSGGGAPAPAPEPAAQPASVPSQPETSPAADADDLSPV